MPPREYFDVYDVGLPFGDWRGTALRAMAAVAIAVEAIATLATVLVAAGAFCVLALGATVLDWCSGGGRRRGFH